MCFVYSHVPSNQTESVRIENLPNIKLFARKFKKLNIRKMENLKTIQKNERFSSFAEFEEHKFLDMICRHMLAILYTTTNDHE